MPRDSMTCTVQKIAKQALATFRGPCVIGEHNKVFVDNQSKLRSLLADVKASDLKIVPRSVESACPRGAPPVTYMHICENDAFSMGVFLLRSGACIPLHDHPGMYGMLKVIYGKARVSCFDRLDQARSPGQRSAVRASVRASGGEYTEESDPCVLSPHTDNIHQIDAVDGPTAFLDVLAPPYDPDEGRDCHYYRVERSGAADECVWLTEVPQPSEFWCGGEPYPGPKVIL